MPARQYSKKRTKKQKEAQTIGKKGEIKVIKLLKKRGYRIIYSHQGKANSKPYDLIAVKGKDKIIVEVKSGLKPPIKITNFEKMLNKKGITKIILALVGTKYIHLLEYRKMSFAGVVAANTRKLRRRAKKAIESRQQNRPASVC